MDYKTVFIITSYISGLGSIFLITYRTLLAFFSESKSIVVHINMFGEQYADLVALAIIWGICIVGTISLYKVIRDRDKHD